MARLPLDSTLDDAQQALLLELVDAQETLPRVQRMHFLLLRASGGDVIVHPAFKEERAGAESDLREMEREGLIRIDQPGRDLGFDITNRGYALAREIRAKRGEGVQQVEAEVMRYVSAARFAARHPQAAAKLQAAEDALTRATVEPSAIGHFCREAFQEFAHGITLGAAVKDKAKTKNRLRAAIELRRESLGDTRADWINALVEYTSAVIDLTQRQEHIGAAAAEPDPEDARVVVFQTAVALYEVDRILTAGGAAPVPSAAAEIPPKG